MDLLRPVDITLKAIFVGLGGAAPSLEEEIAEGEHVFSVSSEVSPRSSEGTLYVRQAGEFEEVVPSTDPEETYPGNLLLRMPEGSVSAFGVYRQGSLEYV